MTLSSEYTRHDMVTSDTCNSGHSENSENIWTFSCMKFLTKWYTKLNSVCNSVDPFLRKCITKSIFQYLKIKRPKTGLALKFS